MNETPAMASAQPAGAPPPRECLLSLAPFIVRRRVVWGECDPAGVVYTPRFGDFAADAGQLFVGHVLGGGYTDGKRQHGIGTPCKALSFVFHASLRPDELFDIAIEVGRIGNTTFELLGRGRTLEGRPVFDSSTTLVTVAHGTRQPVPVPEAVRALLLPHQRSPH